MMNTVDNHIRVGQLIPSKIIWGTIPKISDGNSKVWLSYFWPEVELSMGSYGVLTTQLQAKSRRAKSLNLHL